MGGRVAREAQHSSRNAFFDHRADTVEVKDLFRSDKVTEFSCTLDKVTVQHRSFTVLLTFFFMDGKIFCLPNSLITVKEDEYNANGTVKMWFLFAILQYNSSVRCTSVFRGDNEAGCKRIKYVFGRLSKYEITLAGSIEIG